MNKSSIEGIYFSNPSLGDKNNVEINSKVIIGQFQNVGDFEENEGVGFVDPYDSVWLKIATAIVYTIEILSSLVIFAFIDYEKHYGHFRTLINQLLSILYGVVSLFVMNLHCDPLMMQQKEARRKHPCLLPKKVAFLV